MLMSICGITLLLLSEENSRKRDSRVDRVYTMGLDVQHIETIRSVYEDEFQDVNVLELVRRKEEFQEMINSIGKGDNLRIIAQKNQLKVRGTRMGLKESEKVTTVDDLTSKLNSEKMAIREAELRRIHGSRWDKYRADFAAAREFRDEFDFPLYIMLEQTYQCNLACPTCVQGHKDYRGKYHFDGVMPWDLYERIVLEGEEHNLPLYIHPQ